MRSTQITLEPTTQAIPLTHVIIQPLVSLSCTILLESTYFLRSLRIENQESDFRMFDSVQGGCEELWEGSVRR